MAVLGIVAIIGVTAGVISMLWPSTEPFYAARIADLEPFVPQHFPNEGFWLVLLEDGEIHAFVDRDTRWPAACDLTWESPAYLERRRQHAQLQRYPEGLFRAYCSGSVFHPDGTLDFGPSPRNLDRHPIEVQGGYAEVDLSRVIEGAPTSRGSGVATSTPAGAP
jgi:hypothetical protein